MGSLGAQAGISRKVPKRTDPEGVAEAKERKTKAYKTKENFNFLYGKQRGVCPGCDLPLPWTVFTFDHMTPQDKGGSDELDNLQLLCNRCNNTKGTGTMEQLKARLRKNREALGMADSAA